MESVVQVKMEAKDQQLLEAGLGNVTWWGYSPAFNILEKMESFMNGIQQWLSLSEHLITHFGAF